MKTKDEELEVARLVLKPNGIYRAESGRAYSVINGEAVQVEHHPEFNALLDRLWTEVGLPKNDDEPIDKVKAKRWLDRMTEEMDKLSEAKRAELLLMYRV